MDRNSTEWIADMNDATAAPRPLGTITTLLDLATRDLQDDDLFPLTSTDTWFTRDTQRRLLPFSPLVQTIPFRGPAAFGQRFSFDLGSLLAGDLLFGAVLQIRLNHWLPKQIQLVQEAGKLTFTNPATTWEYANCLGAAIIAKAELEIDGSTIETIDGDFTNVFSLLFSDLNSQFGSSYDALGRISQQRLMTQTQPRLFPTEDGTLHALLPFFFMRNRYQDALPLTAIKEGLVRVHVTLRPFAECVRQLRGYRDTCTSTPLGSSAAFTSRLASVPSGSVTAQSTEPELASVQLMTYGAIVDGSLRKRMLYTPFELLHRQVQTFTFDEPLKYTVSKTQDCVRIQLPLEANHPLEEIVWFVRRKGVASNNAWTNYTALLDQEWVADPAMAPRRAAVPLLQRATLQANGVVLCDAEEQYYRALIAEAHRGGIAAYNSFVYGYPFARTPGDHQPSGSLNASRVDTLRLTLEVRPPGGVLDGAWEVKVFCIGLNWMRFENGLANAMFQD